MIVDTNILIDYLRDKEEAIHFLEVSEPGFSISVISITELYAGIKNPAELQEVMKFLTSFVIHDVGEEISKLAGNYLNQYAKSHHIGIADALIAATAASFGEQLATLNKKDFPMIPGALKPY